MRKETSNSAIHHLNEEEISDFIDLVHRHLLPPLKLFLRKPIVLLITIYATLIYGILYLFQAAYRVVFTECRRIHLTLATLTYINLSTRF